MSFDVVFMNVAIGLNVQTLGPEDFAMHREDFPSIICAAFGMRASIDFHGP